MRSEHVEQREFVSWWRKNRDERIFAIPNGEHRAPSVALRLKVEGVSKGVPDLYIPALKTWVEMKKAGGVVSKEQKDWHAYLESIGDTVIVAYGCEDAIKMLIK